MPVLNNETKTELIGLIRKSGTAGLLAWKSKYSSLLVGDPCVIDLSSARICGVDLNDADLRHVNLSGAHLKGTKLVNAKLSYADLTEAHLEGAFLNSATLHGTHLRSAQLESACFRGADLEGAHLNHAIVDGTDFLRATLTGADFSHVRCVGEGKTDFTRAILCGATLDRSVLPKAIFEHANLTSVKAESASWTEANLSYGDISSAELKSVDLRDVTCQYAIVNGATLIDSNCIVGRHTDFSGTGLSSIRIPPELLAELEYNIRRVNWGNFYKHRRLLGLPWRLFWLTSDYGKSTGRIVFAFILTSFVFAVVYLIPTPSPSWFPEWLPQFECEPIVANLDSYETESGEKLRIEGGKLWLRSFYFSIVTMTTLGFGDMHANPSGYWGHILIALQVILGYVLLGALITRLAILFQSKSAR